MPESLKIAVVGTGYVGLVSGACLAAKGHRVSLLDLRTEVVASINRGVPTIHEKGLPELLDDVVRRGALRAQIATSDALEDSDVILVCVGTPSKSGAIDLSQIRSASEMIGAWLRGIRHFASVVVKSTVLPSTTDTFVAGILEQVSGKKLSKGEFGLGMNPEFLREGEAVGDFNTPDRIVFGYEDKKTLELLEKVYASWHCDKISVNTRTAEMIKYANNCLLALQISAVNELANIAAASGGIDFMEVVDGVGLDKRWSPMTSDGQRVVPGILSYLVPGCGFGGSCFPKDVQSMRTLAAGLGLKPRVLQAILDTNDLQPRAVLAPLLNTLGDGGRGKCVLILGMAFKPGTDDVRESASLEIARHLKECGALVLAHDPVAMPNAIQALGEGVIESVENWEDALRACDAVILATRWPEYQGLKAHAASLTGKVILDCRRLLRAEDFPGSEFLAVGKSPKRTEVHSQ